MTELEQILRQHAARYPQMQPTDAVKLIYQNEFGGGHMITNQQACLGYLHREYASVAKDPALPLYESIGNGIVRVNLQAVEEAKLDALGKAFIASAEEHTGSQAHFLEKLEILCKLTGAGIFSFGSDALGAYLAGYEADGYPAVSHSQKYRECYHPAYRVILEKYLLQL